MSPIPLGVLAGSALISGAFELIQTVNISTDTASVNLSGFNNLYKHLQIRAVFAGSAISGTNTDVSLEMTINSNSTSSYTSHILFGRGGPTNTSNASTSTNNIRMNYLVPIQANSGTTQYGSAIIDILDSTSANKKCTIRLFGGQNVSTASVIMGSGMIHDTMQSVSSIILQPGGAPFKSGSRISIYGIKG